MVKPPGYPEEPHWCPSRRNYFHFFPKKNCRLNVVFNAIILGMSFSEITNIAIQRNCLFRKIALNGTFH